MAAKFLNSVKAFTTSKGVLFLSIAGILLPTTSLKSSNPCTTPYINSSASKYLSLKESESNLSNSLPSLAKDSKSVTKLVSIELCSLFSLTGVISHLDPSLSACGSAAPFTPSFLTSTCLRSFLAANQLKYMSLRSELLLVFITSCTIDSTVSRIALFLPLIDSFSLKEEDKNPGENSSTYP